MKIVFLLMAVVVVGIGIFEATMDPSGSERLQLLAVFLAMAAVTAILVVALRRVSTRFTTLRTVVVGVALVGLGLVAAVTLATAQLMFVTVHDLSLLIVVISFGSALGVVLAVSLALPLQTDLDRMRRAADLVGGGDLSARTGVVRPDELGAAARAFDDMAARLEANQRARREFLAAIGHDLRTPLAALRAGVEALEDGVAADPARYYRSINADLDAMGRLIDDLAVLATIESGGLEVPADMLDLAELADESIEAMAPVATSRGVTLRLDAAGGVSAIGGHQELSRVIRNLVDNAIRHAPEASEVVVRVSNGSGPELSVVDGGPGFAPDFVESAFESFATGDPARSRSVTGAGLGLAIARGFVTAHGGEIWALPGPGGHVGFRLPPVKETARP